MKLCAGALVVLAVLFGASACGSGHPASGPSTDGSYAWQPVPGGPALACSLNYRLAAGERIDYGGHPYFCKLPAPVARDGRGGVDFFGPTTVAAGSVPLGPHAQRIYINVFTPRPAVLRVDFGDGTHWQRAVAVKPGGENVNVVHSYAPTSHAFLLVTLRDKSGYLAVEGEGPFRAPLAGPRTRYCTYIADGKGGTLSATKSLPCATAEQLYSSYNSNYPHGAPHGYHCRESGLPPWGSDVNVVSCTSGTRAFVFTSNP